MSDIQQIIQKIGGMDPNHICAAKAVRDNSALFSKILKKAREENLSLPNLRIDVYKALSVYDDPKRHEDILPFEGNVVTEKYVSDSDPEDTFEITFLEKYYPQPYESSEAARAATQEIDEERYQTIKQEVTNVIAQAVLWVSINQCDALAGKKKSNRGRPPDKDIKTLLTILERNGTRTPEDLTDRKKLRSAFADLERSDKEIPGVGGTDWLNLLDDPQRRAELITVKERFRVRLFRLNQARR